VYKIPKAQILFPTNRRFLPIFKKNIEIAAKKSDCSNLLRSPKQMSLEFDFSTMR
jgi:hypothetical protein